MIDQDTAAAMAALAGHTLEEAVAARVAAAIGPALAAFAELEGTLPFEAEPSGFQKAQSKTGESA
nr:hypothetical protein [Aureimonas populi]